MQERSDVLFLLLHRLVPLPVTLDLKVKASSWEELRLGFRQLLGQHRSGAESARLSR